MVVIAGGGPTGLMLAGELALAGVDVAIVEGRLSQDLAGSRAGGLHARTIEVLDQRGIADRCLAEGQIAQVAAFAGTRLDISDFPSRHPYGLGLWQNHIERILADWADELAVPIQRGREVTGLAQAATGVDVELADGEAAILSEALELTGTPQVAHPVLRQRDTSHRAASGDLGVSIADRRPDSIFVAPFEQGEIRPDLFRKACEFGVRSP